MFLVRVQIEDGPTKKGFDEAVSKGEKIYFKVEGEYYPHIVKEINFLENECVKILGKTLTGLFVATYDFKTRSGYVITKYGRIVDDV